MVLLVVLLSWPTDSSKWQGGDFNLNLTDGESQRLFY